MESIRQGVAKKIKAHWPLWISASTSIFKQKQLIKKIKIRQQPKEKIKRTDPEIKRKISSLVIK